MGAADDHFEEDAGVVLAGEGALGDLGEEGGHHVLQREGGQQDLFDQLAGRLQGLSVDPAGATAVGVSALAHGHPRRRRAESLPAWHAVFTYRTRWLGRK